MKRRKIRRYAEGTSVEVGKTRVELERLLETHEAAQVVIGNDNATGAGFVAFTLDRRQYRLQLPPREAGVRRKEQVEKERWRALLLLIKGKLEVIASGLVTAEQEFLAYLVTLDGKTMGELLAPQIEQMYTKGTMPKLLPESR